MKSRSKRGEQEEGKKKRKAIGATDNTAAVWKGKRERGPLNPIVSHHVTRLSCPGKHFVMIHGQGEAN